MPRIVKTCSLVVKNVTERRIDPLLDVVGLLELGDQGVADVVADREVLGDVLQELVVAVFVLEVVAGPRRGPARAWRLAGSLTLSPSAGAAARGLLLGLGECLAGGFERDVLLGEQLGGEHLGFLEGEAEVDVGVHDLLLAVELVLGVVGHGLIDGGDVLEPLRGRAAAEPHPEVLHLLA